MFICLIYAISHSKVAPIRIADALRRVTAVAIARPTSKKDVIFLESLVCGRAPTGSAVRAILYTGTDTPSEGRFVGLDAPTIVLLKENRRTHLWDVNYSIDFKHGEVETQKFFELPIPGEPPRSRKRKLFVGIRVGDGLIFDKRIDPKFSGKVSLDRLCKEISKAYNSLSAGKIRTP